MLDALYQNAAIIGISLKDQDHAMDQNFYSLFRRLHTLCMQSKKLHAGSSVQAQVFDTYLL